MLLTMVVDVRHLKLLEALTVGRYRIRSIDKTDSNAKHGTAKGPSWLDLHIIIFKIYFYFEKFCSDKIL